LALYAAADHLNPRANLRQASDEKPQASKGENHFNITSPEKHPARPTGGEFLGFWQVGTQNMSKALNVHTSTMTSTTLTSTPFLVGMVQSGGAGG
jgi:hypothetical protein